MKILLYIFLLSLFLNAAEQNSEKLTPLELFLFKIGYTALISDFENEKNITSANTKDIQKLKQSIDYLLNIDNGKLNSKSNLLIIHDKNNKNNDDKLKKEINVLKDEIKSLKVYIDSQLKLNKKPQITKREPIDVQKLLSKPSKSNKMSINGQNINVRDKPFLSGKIVANLKYGDIVVIEYCNEFGWCKIKDKNQYIAKYLLTK